MRRHDISNFRRIFDIWHLPYTTMLYRYIASHRTLLVRWMQLQMGHSYQASGVFDRRMYWLASNTVSLDFDSHMRNLASASNLVDLSCWRFRFAMLCQDRCCEPRRFGFDVLNPL